jgi:hypothetical protein
LYYYSTDIAGNVESTNTLVFYLESPTTTTVSASLNPITVGQSVTFKAKVTPTFGVAAAGTVTFYDGATAVGSGTVSGGIATSGAIALAIGTHSITAAYGGSAADLASTSSVLSEVVYGPPAVVSVSPTSGVGTTQAFTSVYSSPSGISNLSNVRILLNAGLSGVDACYVTYYPATNSLYLENNTNNGTTGPITPGSSATLSNTQCTLSGAGTTVTTSRNNLTVKYSLTFASTFTGTRQVYLLATNATANSSGWVQKGTWTPVSLGNPAIISVSPTSGTGITQTFTGVYSDPNGISDLSNVRILLNAGLSGVNACYVTYYPATNSLYLENNTNNGTTGPITPGSSATLSNTQCTLSGAGTTATTSGNNLTVNYALAFASTFTGTKQVYLLATNANGNSSGWVQKGTWTP